MAGNILIASVVLAKPHLHKPMYFFLANLSLLETCYTSTVLPRILASFINDYHGISFNGCFIQFYFFAFLAAAESYLFSVMSYDRYVAICKPLYYVTLMNTKLCVQLLIASWMIGIVASAFTTFFASQLNYCGPNEIDHFFCDYTPLLMLSCSDTQQTETVMTVLGSACTLPPLLFTLASYVCIIITILRIPSNSGRGKAFSTCSSHLIVVSLFYGTLIIVYILPKTKELRDLNKVFSVFYTILTPMINPFIYTLRNREFKEAVRKTMAKLLSSNRIHETNIFFTQKRTFINKSIRMPVVHPQEINRDSWHP
ncbi:PREDICTED: olfactory receptor 11L1-like [Gekko japonicus]|uniref:Olfactory receptor 11L1-like n=1 Tax=Gekko japonicus TaxID=146911 RepID=A0ABM1KNP4_GEKJA|nr:PREDICTED: olfactory receptor 11L1-like [Gekko japonicus]